jgi:hypothetical protein
MAINISTQLKTAAASYARAAVSAGVALYVAGNHDPKALGSAALGAVAAPLLRALNPKDTSVGINAGK